MVSAVITADIVNSTHLDSPTERRLMKTISSILAPTKYIFYRGDSIQAYIEDPHSGLRFALLLRAAARRIEQPAQKFDMKVSLGLGKVQTPVKELGVAKGDAFLLSGRSFDELQLSERNLVISSANEVINTGFEILAVYVDDIFNGLTSKQAAVIFELLQHQTQQKVAKHLHKSQATINKHVKAARWPQLQTLLAKFDQFLKLMPA